MIEAISAAREKLNGAIKKVGNVLSEGIKGPSGGAKESARILDHEDARNRHLEDGFDFDGDGPRAAGSSELGHIVHGRDLTDDLDYHELHNLTIYGAPGDFQGDGGLLHIVQRQGFDGPPKVVGPEGIREVVAAGGIELFRGVQIDSHITEFKSGRFFPGLGVFGNGTYASRDRSVASDYAGPGGILRMALRPDARIISYSKLCSKQQKALRAIDRELRSLGKFPQDSEVVRRTEELKVRKKVLGDEGRFAAVTGECDAYYVRSVGDWVILNRTAVVVER
ncbi:hypothetical protein [Nocardia brevicatena]|uniref:hypothetical protein n=1 Tax=Nocardia brevicatena TaxID=37327 RepID=UPI0012F71DDF|nr:hypothetical protein [Nocardia brevicatena]